MTTGFTIDDVRDTLTNDVSRFLGRIEMAARDVLERTELGMEMAPHTLPLFQLIADHGHALQGTTRLVSALSLASSAERMEQLALQGRTELDRAMRHLSLARELASAMAGGATDMLAMLSLELDARPGEAQVIAESWRMRVEDVLFRGTTSAGFGLEPANANSSAVAPPAPTPPTLPPVPAPPPAPAPPVERSLDSGWGDFGDDALDPVARAPSAALPALASEIVLSASRSEGFSFASSHVESASRAAIDAELAEVFGVEAQATFAMIDEKLAGLAEHPDDRNLLKAAERAFHTLKGAAATVGLAALSARAAELQADAEALMDAATEPTADQIAALIRTTAGVRALAGIPSAPTPSLARPSPPPRIPAPPALAEAGPAAMLDEVAAELEREARVAFDEAEHLIGRLREADGDEAELARQLLVVMHRLKGSAHVTGFLRLADAAAGIERLAEQSPLDVGRLAAEIAAAEALLAAPPTAAPPSVTTSVGEARHAFGVELREVLQEASGLVPALRAGDAATRARLARMFHRLKGSALVADDDALATQAATIDAALDAGPAAAGAAADELAERILALAARAGGHTGEGAAQRIAVPVLPRELEPEFQQECADLLEALDRGALALERAARPHDVLDELMRNYHTLKGVVNALGLRPLGDQLHKIEDVLEQLRARPVLPALRELVGLLLPCHGELRKQLRTVRLGYVELVPGRLEARIAQLLARGSRATASVASASGLGSALRRSRGSRGSRGSDVSNLGDIAGEAPDRRNVRVPVERLEALMNLAGELVINRSRLLSRIDWLRGLQGDLGHSSRRVLDLVEKFRDDHEFSNLARGASPARPVRWTGFSELELDRYEDVNILARSLAEGSTDLQELFGQLATGLGSLADDSDTLGTIVSGIQGEITRARMVPLDAVFSRLQLPVRDAAQREGREVQIETVGASVHLDKTIVDAIFQPMLHLVRNAVSHGIEPRSERLAAGKPAHGKISLRARQELGQVVIEVADDGAGLDLERLRARGAAMGLIAADTSLDDPRVRDLVFAQGLSTHAQVDAVAGRGVGCDVVRRAVERLNGSVRVESVARQRTVFVIVLPLTLAITRALLVRQGGDSFAVPLYFIERIVDAQELDIIESANQRRIDIDGTFVPIRALGEFVQGATTPHGPILLLQIGGQRLVVQVDEVLTQEEIVVKSLGTLLRGHPMFAGVTIRGTGEVVLILDVPGMADGVLGRQPEARARLREPDAGSAAPPAEVVDEAVLAVVPDADPSRPLRVLFVDDSVSVRKVAERALRSLGVDVLLATDGIDALDKLRAAHVDMVFTDLEMPRMHGYELIRELRFLPAYHALPLIVVTSRSGKKHRDEAQALGASEYLTKPFTPRSLATALLKFGGERARSAVMLEAAGGAGS